MKLKDKIRKERSARKRRERAQLRPQSCNGCTACCTCVAVGELRKGFYTACPHCTAFGCAIYDQRPEVCRIYRCAYSAGIARERPDQYGVLFSWEFEEDVRPILSVYEVRPDVFIHRLGCVLEEIYRLRYEKGVVFDHANLHRYGTEVPNEWEGQHYRTKAVPLGDPHDPGGLGPVWLSVRSGHEEEDYGWWMRALEQSLGELTP